MNLPLKVSDFARKTRLKIIRKHSDKANMKTENQSFSEILSSILQQNSNENTTAPAQNDPIYQTQSTRWWELTQPHSSTFAPKSTYHLNRQKVVRTPPQLPPPPPIRPVKIFQLKNLSPQLTQVAKRFFTMSNRPIPETITDIELKGIYRNLAKLYHPDAQRAPDSRRTEAFRNMKSDYQILRRALESENSKGS